MFGSQFMSMSHLIWFRCYDGNPTPIPSAYKGWNFPINFYSPCKPSLLVPFGAKYWWRNFVGFGLYRIFFFICSHLEQRIYWISKNYNHTKFQWNAPIHRNFCLSLLKFICSSYAFPMLYPNV